MIEFVSLLLTVLMFIIFDSFWFLWSVDKIYKPVFSAIQGSPLQPRMGGAVFAWLLLGLGIRQFVLYKEITPLAAFARGALFGFIVYGIYNGTNYATLSKYDTTTFVADVSWGTFACAVVAAISSFL